MRSDLLNKITATFKECFDTAFLYPEKPIRYTWKWCNGLFRRQLQMVREAAIWLLGLTIPASLPLHYQEDYHWIAFTKKELIANLRDLKIQIHTLIEQVEAEAAAEQNEYLTTKEFARLSGLTPKTISNYASMGRFESAKFENGQWLIHKNELSSYE